MYEQQVILFVFDYLSCNLPSSFLNTFTLNHDRPNSRLTRQTDLLYVARFKSQFTGKLPLYAFPIIWNRWAKKVSTAMSRYQFKMRTKLVFINEYPDHVSCHYRKCPDCFPANTTSLN